ncbi:CDP-6-deoxy-delta-3,4-glucoseen reductase [Pigmentiphaga sp. H8]|uniref:2Fe-2S iron-sulfur cluster-binding protein n=1 Tax=Pigmentiphaga sp. H8 TaxID=2488560 RepID=UPI000F591E72|nr:2Fe-2S iron-sulfur cluster-binding protein [Pigmentiphaga sp. H8]AZG08277.1 CDP-6-deoxy-delta-3,4-glucoseen reductase [Pigmentiphaga sp. H8]
MSTNLKISCLPVEMTFEATAGESILAAALRAEVVLPHSCKTGLCGTCRARVVDGQVDFDAAKARGLSRHDRDEGHVLLCQTRAVSDVTLECNIVEETRNVPVRRVAARVAGVEALSDDVRRIRLALPEGETLGFVAGQHMNVVMSGGVRRCVSLANAPSSGDGWLEMHLRNYGGVLSRYVFESAKDGDLMRMEGPLGTFVLRNGSDRPLLFVASGTGFSPVKAMIETLIRQRSGRPMALYWGGRRPSDLYLHELASRWHDEARLIYVPVVSDGLATDAWQGRTGFVHQAVIDDFDDLSGHDVYVCGAPAMVEAARREFIGARGLPSRQFFADVFQPS